MVILSTRLSSVGHIILVYDTAPDSILVCNDPWGNANKPNYGKKINGAGVKYTYQQVQARWMVEVWA
jgi:hypothetical protein